MAGLAPSEVRALERLYRRRVPPRLVTTPELARALTESSRALRRQVGVLVDRGGMVESVVVGDANRIELPELARARSGATRLAGVRLVHTHLRGEPLTRDDLTDLSVLRLDLVAAIEVLPDGLPGRVHLGHLVAENPEGRQWTLAEWRSPHEVDLDPAWLVETIEAELSRAQASRSQAFNPDLPSARRGAAAGHGAAGERTILVAVTAGRDEAEATESLAELRELARTAGLAVVDTVVQRRPQVDPRYVLGQGKAQDLVVRSKQLGAGLIVFDGSLSASQIRNLSELTDQKILDRTQLILDIFAQHARSREGKIQVELAQLKYLLPRLTGKGTAMSRLAGGIGARGPGETKLETDRRRIRKRIAGLEREIRELARGRGERRKLRRREGLPIVSIVGYTNAGKSTLLNRLTGSSVRAEDKLFATLDPSSRRLRFPRERDLVVTDTVGFIRDLPEELLHAFRATLEELEDADLLVHVVDASSPARDEHVASVEEVLATLDLGETPRLLVLNKIDRLSREDAARALAAAARDGGVAVSVLAGVGMPELVAAIRARVAEAEARRGLRAARRERRSRGRTGEEE